MLNKDDLALTITRLAFISDRSKLTIDNKFESYCIPNIIIYLSFRDIEDPNSEIIILDHRRKLDSTKFCGHYGAGHITNEVEFQFRGGRYIGEYNEFLHEVKFNESEYISGCLQNISSL